MLFLLPLEPFGWLTMLALASCCLLFVVNRGALDLRGASVEELFLGALALLELLPAKERVKASVDVTCDLTTLSGFCFTLRTSGAVVVSVVVRGVLLLLLALLLLPFLLLLPSLRALSCLLSLLLLLALFLATLLLLLLAGTGTLPSGAAAASLYRGKKRLSLRASTSALKAV